MVRTPEGLIVAVAPLEGGDAICKVVRSSVLPGVEIKGTKLSVIMPPMLVSKGCDVMTGGGQLPEEMAAVTVAFALVQVPLVMATE